MRNSHNNSPHITEVDIPKTRTGPAIVNIFAAIPSTKPSLLNSMAGDTIEFAKPVIGTIVPAPANFASLLYTSSPVRSAPINISVMLVAAAALSFVSDAKFIYASFMP